MPKILVIDDNIDNLITVNAVLKSLMPNSKISTSISGKEGIEKIRRDEPDVILLDIQMPEMDGFEVCKIIKSDEKIRHIPIILITASQSSSQDRANGLKLGADAFISKPIDEVELIAQIKVALRIKKSEDLLRNEKNILEDKVREKTEHLRKSYDKLMVLFDGIINTLVAVVEARDPYTAGHQQNVNKLAVAIANELNLEGKVVESIHIASILHDIGKIYIPTEILSKPGMLTDIEFEMLKKHPEFGYEILKNINFELPIAEIVHQHHEKIDGSGYPRKLKGDDIYIEAKILSVADVVEAIMSHRPYRASLGVNVALNEIVENRGILYDAKVVDACVKIVRGNNIFEKK
ncbi:MAG: response regulator [Candidatus Cloacimonetes bacterium]|jgi:putative two-component system response regulator|nr:response regulator [Candidatus Cloacimonadota bacterium]MBT6993735.1 response regulator [Candidatus Cloacimonadota bacterium]MBT7469777.1 response regulator [Candidatus Cloacimonadota bacterium]